MKLTLINPHFTACDQDWILWFIAISLAIMPQVAFAQDSTKLCVPIKHVTIPGTPGAATIPFFDYPIKTFVIKGKVLDRDDKTPLSNIFVWAYGAKNQVVTAADGTFAITLSELELTRFKNGKSILVTDYYFYFPKNYSISMGKVKKGKELIIQIKRSKTGHWIGCPRF